MRNGICAIIKVYGDLAWLMLTHCDLVMPHLVLEIWVNTGSDNSFLSYGTEPFFFFFFIICTNVDLSSMKPYGNSHESKYHWKY